MMQQLLQTPVEQLTYDQLDELVRHLNDVYRQGEPLVSDEVFDQVYLEALRNENPGHEFFVSPQPEGITSKGRISHGERRMLSTQKAYKLQEIEAWIKRCHKSAVELGINPSELEFRLTPKLDGLAGRFEPSPRKLVTRGDGDFGSCVSRLFDLGLKVVGETHDHAVGEIIIEEQYYQDKLSEISPHPRNFVAGIASADDLNEHAVAALEDGAVHLVLYKNIDTEHVDSDTLINQLDNLVDSIYAKSKYRLDGVVIEVTNDDVKSHMGSTGHHHNWQIAKKSVGETAIVTVDDVIWQPSRTSRINPVIVIEKTLLDGANISRITAHNAKYIESQCIGKGAKIKIVRSGSVIPSWIETCEKGEVTFPDDCPSCGHKLEWDDLYLVCNGPACPAQTATRLIHHFKTLQIDLFGPKAVEKLLDAGYSNIEDIYPLTEEDYVKAGFGPGQSKNFVAEIKRVLSEPMRDFLILGSLGIKALGRGSSKKLLAEHPIQQVLNLSEDDLLSIEGFGGITSKSIVSDLDEARGTLNFLLNLGFDIAHTKDERPVATDGPLVGLCVVFTGKMEGSREEMESQAKLLGGIVQKSPNKKTNLLVCGANVGESKIQKCEKLGVRTISEKDYRKEFLF